MNLLKAAQSSILSLAPESFSFADPPSLGWWRAKFGLPLAAVAFAHYYQGILGHCTIPGDGGVHWEGKLVSDWQACSGITPKQWTGAKGDLDADGAHLVTFKGGRYGGTKGVWIRPSDHLMAVFGMTLNTYDVVTNLAYRIKLRLEQAKGAAAVVAANRPVSEEELAALALWASRGGLARLRNADYLGKLLGSHDASMLGSTAPVVEGYAETC
jgi:hypothetical protein